MVGIAGMVGRIRKLEELNKRLKSKYHEVQVENLNYKIKNEKLEVKLAAYDKVLENWKNESDKKDKIKSYSIETIKRVEELKLLDHINHYFPENYNLVKKLIIIDNKDSIDNIWDNFKGVAPYNLFYMNVFNWEIDRLEIKDPNILSILYNNLIKSFKNNKKYKPISGLWYDDEANNMRFSGNEYD